MADCGSSMTNYIKMQALANPELPGDFIMLDEAQDTNPLVHGPTWSV